MKKKARIFIGSSKEGLDWAYKAKALLATDFDVTVWDSTTWDDSVFKINQNFLEALMNATLKYDYGLLIGTTDDKINFRGAEMIAPRDNVIFELGLFLGRLGSSKCAFIFDTDLKIPSDLLGITQASFTKEDGKSFNSAVSKIEAFFKANNHTEINFLPSSTLASVYYENFLMPLCKHISETGALKIDEKDYPECIINVIVPERINQDVNIQFERLKKKFKTQEHTVVYAGRRRTMSLEVAEDRGKVKIIDFPTVISGINHAISHLLPYDFNRQSSDYDLILQRELQNFCQTLESLLIRGGFSDIVCLKKESELQLEVI